MPQPYMLVNEHKPEDCEPMEAGIPKIGPELKGKEFMCTCPGGVHGFFMILEGDSAEEVLALIPDELRQGTRAVPMEVFRL